MLVLIQIAADQPLISIPLINLVLKEVLCLCKTVQPWECPQWLTELRHIDNHVLIAGRLGFTHRSIAAAHSRNADVAAGPAATVGITSSLLPTARSVANLMSLT